MVNYKSHEACESCYKLLKGFEFEMTLQPASTYCKLCGFAYAAIDRFYVNDHWRKGAICVDMDTLLTTSKKKLGSIGFFVNGEKLLQQEHEMFAGRRLLSAFSPDKLVEFRNSIADHMSKAVDQRGVVILLQYPFPTSASLHFRVLMFRFTPMYLQSASNNAKRKYVSLIMYDVSAFVIESKIAPVPDDLYMIVKARDTCANCLVKKGELKFCSMCPAKYCSKECQETDWKRHKESCYTLMPRLTTTFYEEILLNEINK